MSDAVLADKLATLRDAGAPAQDVAGWLHVLSLQERSQAHQGAARALLDSKLSQALDALQARMAAGLLPGAKTAKASCSSSAPPEPSALGQLVHTWKTRRTPGQALQPTPVQPSSLESPRVRAFREELGKLRTHKQVSHALSQAPLNAGPLNSHMLVLKCMSLMREASPDYLQRLVVYVETLQRLAAAGEVKTAKALPAKGKTTSKASSNKSPSDKTALRKTENQTPK